MLHQHSWRCQWQCKILGGREGGREGDRVGVFVKEGKRREEDVKGKGLNQ